MTQTALQRIRIVQIASAAANGESSIHGLDSAGRLWRFESDGNRWVMLCDSELPEDREAVVARQPHAAALVDVIVDEC